MTAPLRVANGAGFLGDQIDAPRRLVESARVDVLTLEYLAELTLSILARAREKDTDAGYAADFLEVLESLQPALSAPHALRLVTNAGGMNPRACARRAGAILTKAGLGDFPVAVVAGDDLLPQLDQLQANGCSMAEMDTGAPLDSIKSHIVSANAYLGAAPIVEALDQGSRVVITGRVADASLTVAPAIHHFGWSWDQWDRLAGASVAGHLIECGAQVTGGYSTAWHEYALADVGYPIAELQADGTSVITKPNGSGGQVNRRTVTEQLVYEIGDPAHYLTPDVDVDFTFVELTEQGADRVAVTGARGGRPPDSYKVSIAYRAGFTASSQLLVRGPDCQAKARACAEIVFQRLSQCGAVPAKTHVELLGNGDGVPSRGGSANQPLSDVAELVLRIAVFDPERVAVDRFTREIAPLITSGPAGLAGYATGRSPVRPVFAYWPALVPKQHITPSVVVKTARDWQEMNR